MPSHPGPLRQRILRALADGPGTGYELAFALDHDSRRLNAYLRNLWTRGLIRRWPHHPAERIPGAACFRRTVWMYGPKRRANSRP